ncbi:hypothetical protein [Corallococcus macrosporus]|uniref:Uncharacterized protein n=1 Tax=Myxococcus fulvus (strain ATCC BAA-855 / HW-1) TaxID=483219 RepID=F8C6J1_MYXFH|nr:hypothetical protein [Corallococcus macrosporus]AEI65580.1 hypothetical protein LILAB_18390 [Corallococcus macrosporus]
MTVLLAVVAAVLAVVLFVVYRRLQDAEFWRAHWRRRYDERDVALSAALSEAQDFRVSVEHALRTVWRRVEVVTPADGAAVAVLRAAFPSLLLPGPRPRPLCPKCEDATCVAPGQCDAFWGADAP